MQRDSLEPALEALSQIPDSYWKGEPYSDIKRYDPFRVDYVDHVVDSMKPDKGNWNIRTIVARIIELKKEVETNPKKRAVDYKLLANAYYNMSYYGKFWIMSKLSWSSAEPEETMREMKVLPAGFKDMYYCCSKAKKYYLLAAQSGHDFESTSFCYYMAGQCKINADYVAWEEKPGHYSWRNDFKDKDKYPYLSFLRKAFPDIGKRLSNRDTTDCTMFEDFLAAADPNNKQSD